MKRLYPVCDWCDEPFAGDELREFDEYAATIRREEENGHKRAFEYMVCKYCRTKPIFRTQSLETWPYYN